jgi:hypothetical protein
MSRQVTVTIDRESLACFLKAFGSGEPITPPDGRWTADALLMLAGAALAHVQVCSASRLRPLVAADHSEQKEAKSATLLKLAEEAAGVNRAVAVSLMTGHSELLFRGDSVQVTLTDEGNEVTVDPPLGGSDWPDADRAG